MTDAGSSPRCGKGFFSRSQLPVQIDSLTGFAHPLCAIARTNICAHVKNPTHTGSNGYSSALAAAVP